MTKRARVIAYYLPQFHPIPENDKWWGEGFTEWDNVKKAKPLFKGHYQPRIPADLGYYDLRDPEIREKQAELAREAGIEGFCYWHYWFGNGKRLLERPFQEVLETGKPDFPFCLGWANHSWTNTSWKATGSLIKAGTLMEQTYSEEDYVRHFYAILPAFKDKRYIRVDGKPLFVVYDPYGITDSRSFTATWNKLAKENELQGIHFVAHNSTFVFIPYRKRMEVYSIRLLSEASRFKAVLRMGFDAVVSLGFARCCKYRSYCYRLANLVGIKVVQRYDYDRIIRDFHIKEDTWENIYPSIVPNRDRTPRAGIQGKIWHGSTPELFQQHVCNALNLVSNKAEEHKIIFLQSWNEWGEGNYMEPDSVFGKQYLDSLREVIFAK
jgi:hypothetical protein